MLLQIVLPIPPTRAPAQPLPTPGLQVPAIRTPVMPARRSPYEELAVARGAEALVGVVERKRARKREEAEALLADPNVAGLTFGEAPPEAAEAFKRVTGRVPEPTEIIGGMQAQIRRKTSELLRDAVADPELQEAIQSYLAAGVMGAPPGTPAEALATRRAAAIAGGRRWDELSPEEQGIVGFATTLFGIVPSGPIAEELGQRQRADIIKASTKAMFDPNSNLGQWAARQGFSVADLLAASRGGFLGLVDTTMRVEAAAAQDIEREQRQVAASISTVTGEPVDNLMAVYRLKARGVQDIGDVPDGLKDAWAAIDSIAALQFNSMLPRLMDTSYGQYAQMMIDMARIASPVEDKELFMSWANGFSRTMARGYAELQIPNFNQLPPEVQDAKIKEIITSGQVMSFGMFKQGLFGEGLREILTEQERAAFMEMFGLMQTGEQPGTLPPVTHR